jgi:arginyl-tRNA--protein-N-Asp/Glu arginylyltransferase
MQYLSWDQKTVSDLSDANISALYNSGYVFTRLGKGVMNQTRSVRIDLSKFQFSSENRRIIKKVDDLSVKATTLPVPQYDFKIGKLAKDFYEAKFGPGIMSANKIKEMLCDETKSNFNTLLEFSAKNPTTQSQTSDQNPSLGYAITYSNPAIMHYSYPFYDLSASPKDMGMGMMLLSIKYALDSGKALVATPQIPIT